MTFSYVFFQRLAKNSSPRTTEVAKFSLSPQARSYSRRAGSGCQRTWAHDDSMDCFSAACEALPFRQLPKPFHRGEKSALRLRSWPFLLSFAAESGTKLLFFSFVSLLAQRGLDRFERLQAGRKVSVQPQDGVVVGVKLNNPLTWPGCIPSRAFTTTGGSFERSAALWSPIITRKSSSEIFSASSPNSS
jgi:hypothetical protein